ncbi:peptidylprolyl isomerase [Kozakia baliensis]|uniref:peptidylprolyl isomerase n=1 Tax=Kozakia baliensis TaxID=153496 RepID=UPI00345BA8FB
MRRAFPVLCVLACISVAQAQTPDEIVAQAPKSDWQDIPPSDLLVMRLSGHRQVVIQLAPDFAPEHVRNIVRLAQAKWWDDGAIVRVQDNYVVQWAGRAPHPSLPSQVSAHLPAEYERPAAKTLLTPLPFTDSYAPIVGFSAGWPVGGDGQHIWLTHCYGMVGVGRDMPPDTGDGTELYTVIGEAPRQLDRNIALVGRVLDGIDALTALPRGKGEMGFYREAAERLSIAQVRRAADLPVSEQPHWQFLRTDSASFARYWQTRANRRDRFFVRPANGVALCNVPVPTRPVSLENRTPR